MIKKCIFYLYSIIAVKNVADKRNKVIILSSFDDEMIKQ